MADAQQSLPSKSYREKLDLQPSVVDALQQTTIAHDLQKIYDVTLEFKIESDANSSAWLSGTRVTIMTAKAFLKGNLSNYQEQSVLLPSNECSTFSANSQTSVEVENAVDGQVPANTQTSVQIRDAAPSQVGASSRTSVQVRDAVNSQVKANSRTSVQVRGAVPSQVGASSRTSVQVRDVVDSQVKANSRTSVQVRGAVPSQVGASSRTSVQVRDAANSQVKANSRTSVQVRDAVPSQVGASSQTSVQVRDAVDSQVGASSRTSIQVRDAGASQVGASSRTSVQVRDTVDSQVRANSQTSAQDADAVKRVVEKFTYLANVHTKIENCETGGQFKSKEKTNKRNIHVKINRLQAKIKSDMSAKDIKAVDSQVRPNNRISVQVRDAVDAQERANSTTSVQVRDAVDDHVPANSWTSAQNGDAVKDQVEKLTSFANVLPKLPDKRAPSNQLENCETGGRFKPKETTSKRNIRVKIDGLHAKKQSDMSFEDSKASAVETSASFFDQQSQRTRTVDLSITMTKLLKLNKNAIVDACQLAGASEVLVSFSDHSCQLKSSSVASLKHAEQKLKDVVKGVKSEKWIEHRVSMIAWLQSDVGHLKLVDLSRLTNTVNSIKLKEIAGKSQESSLLQVVNGNISTITADGIITGLGVTQQAVENVCRQRLQTGLQSVTLPNDANRFVFLVDLRSYENNSTLLILKKFVKQALREFSTLDLKTIAIPALGTGNLGFPCKETAQTIVSAVVEFFNSNPKSSLQTVTFVSYYDEAITSAFKTAVKQLSLSSRRQAIVDIVGLGRRDVSNAKARLKSEMNDRYYEESWATHPNKSAINRLSAEKVDQITKMVEERSIDIISIDTSVNKIQLGGLKSDIQAIKGVLNEELSQLADVAAYPSNWCPKAVERGDLFVPLDSASHEYTTVKDLFLQTSSIYVCSILAILRVQNVYLHDMYMALKTKVGKELSGTDIIVERELWHGTGLDSARLICKNEFNRSFAGKNGTRYGQGCYFSTTTNYSIGFSVDMKEKSMILAKVVTGKSMKGRSDIDRRTLPEGYHSTTDSESDPTIFVVYHDASAYPEYLIKFECWSY